MNKETIASRANNNKLGIKFYKSYVTNVKRVAVRHRRVKTQINRNCIRIRRRESRFNIQCN